MPWRRHFLTRRYYAYGCNQTHDTARKGEGVGEGEGPVPRLCSLRSEALKRQNPGRHGFGKLYAGELVGAAGPWRVALNDHLAVGPLSDRSGSQWRPSVEGWRASFYHHQVMLPDWRWLTGLERVDFGGLISNCIEGTMYGDISLGEMLVVQAFS